MRMSIRSNVSLGIAVFLAAACCPLFARSQQSHLERARIPICGPDTEGLAVQATIGAVTVPRFKGRVVRESVAGRSPIAAAEIRRYSSSTPQQNEAEPWAVSYLEPALISAVDGTFSAPDNAFMSWITECRGGRAVQRPISIAAVYLFAASGCDDQRVVFDNHWVSRDIVMRCIGAPPPALSPASLAQPTGEGETASWVKAAVPVCGRDTEGLPIASTLTFTGHTFAGRVMRSVSGAVTPASGAQFFRYEFGDAQHSYLSRGPTVGPDGGVEGDWTDWSNLTLRLTECRKNSAVTRDLPVARVFIVRATHCSDQRVILDPASVPTSIVLQCKRAP